tara:strand:+ start:905 stop:1414 length:510 start_codon:yes stop_codon:yes gene_type:complete
MAGDPYPRNWTPTKPPKQIERPGVRRSHDAKAFFAPEWFDAINKLSIEAAQNWRSLMPEVGQPYTLVEKHTPWTSVIDFTNFEGNDHAVIRLHALIAGPNEGQVLWRVVDNYMVSITTTPNKTILTVNETPYSEGRFLPIVPIEGPWPVRLTYMQTTGFNKLVRIILTG